MKGIWVRFLSGLSENFFLNGLLDLRSVCPDCSRLPKLTSLDFSVSHLSSLSLPAWCMLQYDHYRPSCRGTPVTTVFFLLRRPCAVRSACLWSDHLLFLYTLALLRMPSSLFLCQETLKFLLFQPTKYIFCKFVLVEHETPVINHRCCMFIRCLHLPCLLSCFIFLNKDLKRAESMWY